MWYFSWILGAGLAASFAILNGMWYEMRENDREVSARAATLSSAMNSPRASATMRTKTSASSKASPSVAPKSAAGTGRGNAAPRKSRTAVAPKPSRSNKPVKPRHN